MSGDPDGTDEFDETAPADQAGVAGSRVAAELAVLAASRYQPLGELARGGAGRIVRARDLAFDRIVALKEPLDPVGGGDRLRAEAAILASLQHPSIVPIYDHGTRADGVPFFAMKLVEGRSLRDAIRDAPTLELRLALIPQVVAVAEAVAYAHARGVIHRDLKPGNVLVGAFGETIVIDWGIAKTLAGEVTADGRDPGVGNRAAPATETATGAILGTPAYMAPEQARGEHADARADVYALGAILYHLLAGAAPYAGRRDVIAAVLEGPPPPIAEVQPRVPDDLAAIVTKAMARAPGDRYPTAAGVAEDLERFQTGRLVAARTYSLATRGWRLVRRRAGWFAAGGVALASAAIAFALAPGAPPPGAECARAGDKVRAAWTAARRREVLDAFTASGAPYAASVADVVLPRVDRAADALAIARVEACKDTKARGQQSEARLDLRMTCLDRQLAELDATIGVLVKADAAVVERAPVGLTRLDRPGVCDDPGRLALLPAEPADLAVRERLAAVRTRLTALRSAMTWGRDAGMAEESRAIAAEAAAIGYCPVAVDAHYVRAAYAARHDSGEGEAQRARDDLRAAVLASDACGDDHIRAMSLIVLLEMWDPDDVAGLARMSEDARAAAHRDHAPITEVRLLTVLMAAALHAGELDRAIALGEEARTLSQRADAGDPAIALNLAGIYLDKGELDRAQALAEAGMAEARRDYGADHPTVAAAAHRLATIYQTRGDLDRAAAAIAESVRIRTRAFPPEHKDVLSIHAMEGGLALARNRFDECVRIYETNRPIAVRVLGPAHGLAQAMAVNLATCYRALERYDDALPLAREVLAQRMQRPGPDHPATASAHATLGEILHDRGDNAEAGRELRAALAIQRAKLGDGSPQTASTAKALAITLLTDGAAAEALPLARLAVATFAKTDDADARGESELTLARALWDSGGDRALARALVTAARDRAGTGDAVRTLVEAWLAKHPPPP